MAQLTLGVPGLLRDCVGPGSGRVRLDGDTPSQAIEKMMVDFPRLRLHVFDERGEIRQHVFVAINGRKLRPNDLDISLRDGDRIDVVQAVSGG